MTEPAISTGMTDTKYKKPYPTQSGRVSVNDCGAAFFLNAFLDLQFCFDARPWHTLLLFGVILLAHGALNQLGVNLQSASFNPDGTYTLEVLASDTRGNVGFDTLQFTTANGVAPPRHGLRVARRDELGPARRPPAEAVQDAQSTQALG